MFVVRRWWVLLWFGGAATLGLLLLSSKHLQKVHHSLQTSTAHNEYQLQANEFTLDNLVRDAAKRNRDIHKRNWKAFMEKSARLKKGVREQRKPPGGPQRESPITRKRKAYLRAAVDRLQERLARKQPRFSPYRRAKFEYVPKKFIL